MPSILPQHSDGGRIDTTIGEIRLVITDLGLIGLYRDGENITFVRSESLTIARLLLERLSKAGVSVPHGVEGHRIGGRR